MANLCYIAGAPARAGHTGMKELRAGTQKRLPKLQEGNLSGVS